ncbi:MAG: hypothetical protein Q7V63_04630 [Gammaproteobacteria bacterium]|nr:hypothetical protein [Gammaproteobacteria bacterium]
MQQGSLNGGNSTDKEVYQPLSGGPSTASTRLTQHEPMGYSEVGLFLGLIMGLIYFAIRGRSTDVGIPAVGLINSSKNESLLPLLLLLGAFIGPTWMFRAMESIDAWTPAKSNRDRENRQIYPFRFALLQVLPPAAAATSFGLVHFGGITDGVGLFRPDDFRGFHPAEQGILAAIYGGYLGATLAVRLGTALDLLLGYAPWNQRSWADNGLFAGLMIMPTYLGIRAFISSNTLILPMKGALAPESTAIHTVVGTGFGAIVGLFWFYRLCEFIDAWSTKKEGTACRYGLLRLLPLITAPMAICLTKLAGITDAAGLFDPDEFKNFPLFEIVIASGLWGAYVGATAAVRWGNMADRSGHIYNKTRTMIGSYCYKPPFQTALGKDNSLSAITPDPEP